MNDMRISATQDETFTRCQRQWWFLYPQRMPSVTKGDLDFGTVTHEVCERFLMADETGRVPSPPDNEHVDDCAAELGGPCDCGADIWLDGPLRGQEAGDPVELFPEGWDTVEDKKGKRTLPPTSTHLIRTLVNKAIEEGILERRPGRLVEHAFRREVIPGVDIVGKIDLLLPGEVQDHKTTKAMRWAKSPATLAESLQMLNYAHEVAAREPDVDPIRLRHNVFCKDPEKPVVRKVETSVTRAQVGANWERLKKQAADMKALTDAKVPAEDWREVEGPSQAGACEAFGGCPFRRICGGMESPDKYRERTNRQLEQQNNLQPPATWDDQWDRLEPRRKQTTGNHTMTDIFQRRKQARAASPAPEAEAPAPTINGGAAPVTEEPVEAPAPQEAVASGSTPPWADAKCAACKGTGFNSKGSPCRICDSRAKKAGKPTSADFVVDSDGLGNVVWEARDGSGGGSAPAGQPVAEPVAQERIALPETEPEPVLEEAPQEAAQEPVEDPMAVLLKANEEAVEEAEREPEEKPKKERRVKATKRRGRPRTGYFLYIDCMPLGVETVPIEVAFQEIAEQLAKAQGVESYYDLDPFKRREAFARAIDGDVLMEHFNGQHLVARNPGGAPDLRAFVDAIVAAAEPARVVQGIR